MMLTSIWKAEGDQGLFAAEDQGLFAATLQGLNAGGSQVAQSRPACWILTLAHTLSEPAGTNSHAIRKKRTGRKGCEVS